MNNHSISVIYLCYLPYGTAFLRDFLTSYQSFHAGIKHKLIVIFKGEKSPDDIKPFLSILYEQKITFEQLNYNGKGLDMSTYYWAAQKSDTDFLFFLNSSSRILADNWLKKFADAFEKHLDMGMVGATGSWQSLYSSFIFTGTWGWKKSESIKDNIGRYKQLINGVFLLKKYFNPFPNPHLRTNGFFIKREIYLTIHHKNPKTKIDAFRMESGKKSITRQIIKMGLKVCIIDKVGNVYLPENWDKSNVFWNGMQENLIIADNQTNRYSDAITAQKKVLQYDAWEKPIMQF